MLSGITVPLFFSPGGVGKEKLSHFVVALLPFADFEGGGCGVSKPKLLSLWSSDSTDNDDGHSEHSRFSAGRLRISSGELVEGWTRRKIVPVNTTTYTFIV